MPATVPKLNHTYKDGFADGYEAAQEDARTAKPQTQQQFYDLTPHNLDTIAMGIALVVLHADSIQTIEATMETQQKLGLAEKVLGTLHLIATRCGLYHPFVPLHETLPNPWLDLGRETHGAGIAENQTIDDAYDEYDPDGQMGAYDAIQP